eukprot:scaffold39301_cov63-Phaeocystis_antarctica.AAC.4
MARAKGPRENATAGEVFTRPPRYQKKPGGCAFALPLPPLNRPLSPYSVLRSSDPAYSVRLTLSVPLEYCPKDTTSSPSDPGAPLHLRAHRASRQACLDHACLRHACLRDARHATVVSSHVVSARVNACRPVCATPPPPSLLACSTHQGMIEHYRAAHAHTRQPSHFPCC